MAESVCLKCEHKRYCKTGQEQPSKSVTINGCSRFELKHTQTNADKLRAMSDEELAEWLEYNISCSDCRLATMCDVNNGKTCFGWWLEWLQQEVSE